MNNGYTEEEDFKEKEQVLSDLSYWISEVFGDRKITDTLEVGGSGGILSGLFAEKFGSVICTDIVDWDLKYSGQGIKLLKEKFARNQKPFSLELVKYLPADAQNLLFRDNWFDLVFSLNAFEHIPDPALALREAIRVTKPGGMIYIRFDPIWTADSGSHFLHRIGNPWEHLLVEDGRIAEIMRSNNASEDEIESYKFDMNRRPVEYYRTVLPQTVAELGCEMRYYTSWAGTVDDSFRDHPNLAAAAKKTNLTADDLMVRGFQFIIEKARK